MIGRVKAFSMYEVIITLALLSMLSALVIVVSKNAGSNATNRSGQTILLAAETSAQKLSIEAEVYPLYPSSINTLMTVTDLSFVTSASTSSSIVSVYQPTTSTLVLTILTGTSCWILVDSGASQPRWGEAKNPTGACTASSINISSVTSVDRNTPSSISL